MILYRIVIYIAIEITRYTYIIARPTNFNR